MSKISVSFLVGFTLVVSVGAASAQGLDASAMSNSVAAQVTSMEGMRAKAKLSEKEANPFAQAASSVTGFPAGSGTGVDIPVATAKIGGGAADFSLPSNALMDTSRGASANMANALVSAPAASGTPGEGMTSSVVLGMNTSDLSNAVGDQVRSSQRLGR